MYSKIVITHFELQIQEDHKNISAYGPGLNCTAQNLIGFESNMDPKRMSLV
jgi:hypothetical protein